MPKEMIYFGDAEVEVIWNRETEDVQIGLHRPGKTFIFVDDPDKDPHESLWAHLNTEEDLSHLIKVLKRVRRHLFWR